MHEITQSDTRLHLTLKAHQYRFRHVQRHHAGSCGKRHQSRAARERDPHGKARMRITTGTHGVRQQHAIQPAVNNAVAGTQRNATAIHDEIRQAVLGVNIHRFRISGSMAKRLHHQICGKAEAGKIFQLVSSHRPRGVLRAHRGHLRLAVGTWTNAVDPTGLPDHLLGQCITFIRGFRCRWLTE